MNQTSSSDLKQLILMTLGIIEPYYTVLIILVGLISNSITCFMVASKKLKFGRVNPILISLALSDIGFLISLQFVNMDMFDYDLFNKFEVVCKFTVYLSYLSSFLSVWYLFMIKFV